MFSAKPADESTQMSRSVGKIVGEIFISEFHEWPESRQEVFAERIDHPVRKCAHASEYAILGILLCISVSCYRTEKCAMYVFIAGAAYAASDEFHQLFVAGRSCQVTDVLIDSMGVLTGILLIYMVNEIKKQVLQKENDGLMRKSK